MNKRGGGGLDKPREADSIPELLAEIDSYLAQLEVLSEQYSDRIQADLDRYAREGASEALNEVMQHVLTLRGNSEAMKLARRILEERSDEIPIEAIRRQFERLRKALELDMAFFATKH